MLKKQVTLGKTYAAKISGKVVPVTILDESRYGGWDGKNEVTGRPVRIKSAQKLRYEIESYVHPETGKRRWRGVAA